MAEFEKKTEDKELVPETPHKPELDEEKSMMELNVLEKKQEIEKTTKEIFSSSLKIEKGKDGQVWVYRGDKPVSVKVTCCFPWTQPGKYISLRDKDENEIVLIQSLEELDNESRLVLEHALLEAGFVLEVVSIELSEEEFEIRNWKVQTKHGARTFQTKLDDWPRKMPGGGLLIRDVSSDLYYIPNPKTLDEKSRKILWAFLDES